MNSTKDTITAEAQGRQTASAPVYIRLRDIQRKADASRSTVLRHFTPHLTKYTFGPRCVRYREDEVDALLASLGVAAK